MLHDWQKLTRMAGSEEFVVERVRLGKSGVVIEGEFKLPPLAQLDTDDQLFVAAFVRCHGSIKQMEKYFGVSYPTIKNRLNRIGQKFEFVEITAETAVIAEKDLGANAQRTHVLDQLERGEISTDEAIGILKKGQDNE